MPTLSYYRRIFSAYLLGGKSHLTFWHETPAENPNATAGELGEYYMLFAEKADYAGPTTLPVSRNSTITARSASSTTPSRSRNAASATTICSARVQIPSVAGNSL